MKSNVWRYLVALVLAFVIALSGASSDFIFGYCDSAELPFSGTHLDRHLAEDALLSHVCNVYYHTNIR